MEYSNLINNINIKNYISNNFEIVSGTFIGNRKENQDIIKIDNLHNSSIFMIADGHGGNYIAKMVCNKILNNFFKKFKFSQFSSCKKLYKLIDDELYKNYYIKNFKREGSTLTTIIINKNNILGINLGDSCYLIRYNDSYKTGQIHRPINKTEINRIINNKFKITKILKKFRIDGKLEITRSFGDFTYKLVNKKYSGEHSAVSVIPDHKILDVNFKYIIIGSDGFWDFCNLSDTVDLIDKVIDILDNTQIIEKLIKMAINKGSKDNISLILVKKCG